jgi:hypothetical protein
LAGPDGNGGLAMAFQAMLPLISGLRQIQKKTFV